MKSHSRLRTVDLVYLGLFAALMAICAWISVPMPAPLVPFTLQTFAIFAAVTTLGGRRGTYAVGVYLLLGLVGLPVFAGFRSGPGTLLGTTGGYILGFFVCAVVYWLVTAFLGESLWAVFLGGILGLAACYGFGTAWFLLLYIRTTGPMSLGAALGMCVVPYVLPDLCKLALAVLVSRRVRPHLR